MKARHSMLLMIFTFLLAIDWQSAASLMEGGGRCTRIPLDGFLVGIMSMPVATRMAWTHRAVFGHAPICYWIAARLFDMVMTRSLYEEASIRPGGIACTSPYASFIIQLRSIRFLRPSTTLLPPPAGIPRQVGCGGVACRRVSAMGNRHQVDLRSAQLLQEKSWKRRETETATDAHKRRLTDVHVRLTI